MKRCSKCGAKKDITEFSLDRRAKDGHRYVCKACVAIYREEHKEIAAVYYRAYSEVNKDKLAIAQRAYCEKNKERIAIRERAYRERNKQKIAITQRAYRQSDRGKLFHRIHTHERRVQAKSALSDLTIEQWQRILQAQSDRCNICGKKFCKSRKPTFDHVIPLSKGGGLTSDNVQALCRSCNSRKQAKLDPQFIQTWCV